MPVICLGPVCIPLWPVIALAVKPLWDRFVPETIKNKLVALWIWILSLFCPQREIRNTSSKPRSFTADDSENIVTHLRSAEDFEKIKKSDIPVILKFTASWCGPCAQIQPQVDNLARKFAGKVIFAEIDIEELDELSLGLGVSSIPAFHAYKKAAKVGEFVGASSQKLQDLVELVGSNSKSKSK